MRPTTSLTLLQLVLLFTFFFSAQRAWAALENLPFLGEDFPFKIEKNEMETSTGASAILDNLADTLREQRKQSVEFQNISLRHKAGRFDREVIERWLKSEGYFAATLQTRYNAEDIVHNVKLGPSYSIASLTVRFPNHVKAPNMAQLPAQKGQPLKAAKVLATQDFLKSYVQENYCLYKIEVTYTAEINHETRKAFLRFKLRSSPQVVFATPQITGYTQLDDDYLKNYFTFTRGDCFQRKQIELSRLALLQSNLLSRVETIIAAPDGGEVVVSFEVTERNHRTLKAGLGYDSNTGLGITLGWQHRNLLHRGQRLDIDSRFNDVRSNIGAELVAPHFHRKNQTLTLHSDIARTQDGGDISKYGEIGANVNRPLSRAWAASAGINLEFLTETRIDNTAEDVSQSEDYGLLSIPLSLDFNRSNNLLNPDHGWALSIKTQPFANLYTGKNRFIKSSVAVSAYFSAREWPGQPTIALRAATGSIIGTQLDQIPIKHRFYVGGGGSVRGYSYQTAGELKTDGSYEPVGGLSFGETAAELRLRFSDSWGGTVFVDGGFAYAGKRPAFGSDFLWGTGIGIRYFTSFAPIRFDIATPLKKRQDDTGKTIDDSLQIYISIGQAF